MGTYATTTSLSTIMVGTTFDSNTNALALKMITHAENEINKYLSKRYDLSSSTFQTSTSIPPLVTSLCETLAEGYMWQRMSRGSKESLSRGKELVTQAIENLKMIAEYKLDIADSSGTIISDFSNTAYRVLDNTSDYSKTFDEDDVLNWKQDKDKLDDIESERS